MKKTLIIIIVILSSIHCYADGWYKDSCFWRKQSPSWEIVNYTQPVNGKGDMITNTMKIILRENDTSQWAYEALDACKELLLLRQRWPDRMDQSIDAKNRIQWYWSRLMQRTGVNETVLFRPQGYMTRDPYICFFTACVILKKRGYIEQVIIPWHLYRPFSKTWRWRKRLIKGDPANYVDELRYLRQLAIKEL